MQVLTPDTPHPTPCNKLEQAMKDEYTLNWFACSHKKTPSGGGINRRSHVPMRSAV